jgi:hypothetical protein
MTSRVESAAASTSSFSFTSDEDIMASFRFNQDVFGTSIADLDIWADTPEKFQKPKVSLKSEKKRRSSSSKPQHTTEKLDEKKSSTSTSTTSSSSKSTKQPKDEKRKSKSKRSSTSGSSTKIKKERTKDSAAEELAPVLAPLVSVDRSSTSGSSTKIKKERRKDPPAEELAPVLAPLLSVDAFSKARTTARPKQPLHQEHNEPSNLDFLMQRLKKERVALPAQEPRKHKTAGPEISIEPKRFTAASLRSETSSNNNKSYLPRTSASSSENRRSKARRERVSDSLNKFLADSACNDLPLKSALRSVYSTPEEDSKTKKVRPSRRNTGGGESSSERKPNAKSGILEKHLQSMRPRHRQDGAHRSVASAPATATRKKDLSTKCQALKLTF